MSDKLEIRESRGEDSAAMESLNPEAFPDENLLPLARALLNDAAVTISLVGTIDARIVGHAIFTKLGTAVGTWRPGEPGRLKGRHFPSLLRRFRPAVGGQPKKAPPVWRGMVRKLQQLLLTQSSVTVPSIQPRIANIGNSGNGHGPGSPMNGWYKLLPQNGDVNVPLAPSNRPAPPTKCP